MRIFTAVRHAADPGRFYGGLWSANFYPALRALGAEVIESQVDLEPASRFMHVADGFTPEETACRGRLTEQILAELRTAHARRPVDLFLSYFYHAHFDPAGFAEVRRLGIPSVNFYCNSIHQFELVRDVARAADFAWHSEKHAAARYRAAGANAVWLQMAAEPSLCREEPDAVRAPVACFIGQRYADREAWLAALVRAGVPLQVYGAGWGAGEGAGSPPRGGGEEVYLGRRHPRPGSAAAYRAAIRANWRSDGWWGGTWRTLRQFRMRGRSRRNFAAVAGSGAVGGRAADFFAAMNRAAVVLNLANVWSDGRPGSELVPHVRLRDFEAPMAGACYLTAHTDEIAECYEPGREIETYASVGEWVDKTRFLLAQPVAAARLRAAGRARAHRDHTWERRFRQLFDRIGLKVAA